MGPLVDDLGGRAGGLGGNCQDENDLQYEFALVAVQDTLHRNRYTKSYHFCKIVVLHYMERNHEWATFVLE